MAVTLLAILAPGLSVSACATSEQEVSGDPGGKSDEIAESFTGYHVTFAGELFEIGFERTLASGHVELCFGLQDDGGIKREIRNVRFEMLRDDAYDPEAEAGSIVLSAPGAKRGVGETYPGSPDEMTLVVGTRPFTVDHPTGTPLDSLTEDAWFHTRIRCNRRPHDNQADDPELHDCLLLEGSQIVEHSIKLDYDIRSTAPGGVVQIQRLAQDQLCPDPLW